MIHGVEILKPIRGLSFIAPGVILKGAKGAVLRHHINSPFIDEQKCQAWPGGAAQPDRPSLTL
jgi:hypothetical protein